MKKTIVFDIGGVLIDWNPRYLYEKIFTDPDELDFFLRAVCSPAWNATIDVGKSFWDAIDELVPLHPEYEDQIRAYFTRWDEMLGGDIPGTVEILKELKEAGYPLAVLSNFSSETLPIVEDQYGFLGWFEPLVISGRAGYAKPDPSIYQILLHELGQDARECVFIDDKLENIQEANRQGFEGIHFTSPENLRKNLVTLSIL